MILCVDIGNTQIKWAWLYQGELSPVESCRLTQLSQAQMFDSARELQAIYVANVAGATIMEEFEVACLKTWARIRPISIVAQEQILGLKNGYKQADSLGVDRWLAMIAVMQMQLLPCCLISCGTAITVDYVDVQANHLGGYILPGSHLMSMALNQNTQGVRAEFSSRAAWQLGKNTQDAVNWGIFRLILAFLIELNFYKVSAIEVDIQKVMTGGGAEVFLPYLPPQFQHEPHLVIKGLSIIATHQGQS